MSERPAGGPVDALPLRTWLSSRPAAPVAFGAALTLALLAVRVGASAAAGDLQYMTDPETADRAFREARIGLVISLLVGFVPLAYGLSVAGLRTALAALAPAFGRDGALPETLAAEAGRIPPASRRLWGAFGLALALAIPFAVDREPTLYLQAHYWRADTILNWLLLPPLGIGLALGLRSMQADSGRLSRAADAIAEVDLLDPRALAPFGRYALRVALLVALVPSAFAILLGDHGFAPLFGLLTPLAAAAGLAAFLRPVRGIHRRIAAEKAAELGRVRAALRGDPAALAKSPVRTLLRSPTLADLLAWEARVDAVREWPFDVSTAARLAAFLLLPLGSWLGGALVERVVEGFLG